MHHHRVTTTALAAGEIDRLHFGTTNPTPQSRVSFLEARPDHVDNFNHHTNA